MNADTRHRLAFVALIIAALLLFWVWIYHVLIGGASPVLGVVYTVVGFLLIMVPTVGIALWHERWKRRRGE